MKPLRLLILVCAFLVFAPVLAVAEQGAQTGIVAETIESGGYVYIRLEEQDKWLAARTFAVSVGDKVQYSGGMEMNEFESKSLDRTFESIWFVSQASLVGDVGDVGDVGAASRGDSHPAATPPKMPVVIQPPAPGDITPLKEGKTVAAIFTESAELKEQVVSLNARVMKVGKNIMGRNWITLQDGTGVEPDNKLLATTQELVSPGDLVIVKGTVATDVDIGYGYEYKVLLEEATFSSGLE
jgi:hypothetical protein